MDDKTGRRQNLIKKFSPALFGLILISFFLQFVAFSVAGVRVASVTGVQLVTGAPVYEIGTPRIRAIEGLTSRFPSVDAAIQSVINDHNGRFPGTWLAVIVLLGGIVGLAAGLLKSQKTALIPLAAAAIALVALSVLRVGIDGATLSKGQGLIAAGYGIGFYLMSTLFLAALILNSYLALMAWWANAGRSGTGPPAKKMGQRKAMPQ